MLSEEAWGTSPEALYSSMDPCSTSLDNDAAAKVVQVWIIQVLKLIDTRRWLQ